MCEKKNLGILIIEILKNHSDKNKPLTKCEIAEYLSTKYNRKADQRTIISTLDQLISYYKSIRFTSKIRGKKVFKHGFYIESETYDDKSDLAELSLITSPLPENDEIKEILHKNNAFVFFDNVTRFNKSNSDIKSIINLLFAIFRAIKDKYLLNFALIDFIAEDKKHYTELENKVKRYLCAPIGVVSSYGRLWLFAELGDTGIYRYFPIDKISDLRITELKFSSSDLTLPAPICQLEGERMLVLSREKVILKVRNSYLGEFTEKLGLSYKLRVKHGEYSEIEVLCDINALKRHILSFGSQCEILSPTKLRRSIALELQSACSNYKEIRKLKGYI